MRRLFARINNWLMQPTGRRCPCWARRVLLRSLADYGGRVLPPQATDAEIAVAIMESFDELRQRAETAEVALRAVVTSGRVRSAQG